MSEKLVIYFLCNRLIHRNRMILKKKILIILEQFPIYWAIKDIARNKSRASGKLKIKCSVEERGSFKRQKYISASSRCKPPFLPLLSGILIWNVIQLERKKKQRYKMLFAGYTYFSEVSEMFSK